MEIKCVFQGGGAKLATLLLVAEVLQELQEANDIKVTEVAGTSAGSIAAFLFATGIPIATFRSRMIEHGSKVIDKFKEGRTTVGILWQLVRGNPIYDEALLREFLRAVINGGATNTPLKLSDTVIPVHIRVSDVRQGKKFTYKWNDDVVAEEALVDSCAIPFAIRSYPSRHSRFDGGIVSNLPDSSIFRDPSKNIVAFSFDNEGPYEYSGLKGFGKSLISTIIDGNVEQSVERIRSEGGEVCRLPVDFKTFEFEKAYKEGLSERYVNDKKEKIQNLIKGAVKLLVRKDRRFDGTNREKNLNFFSTKVFNSIGKTHPWSVVGGSITCIADNLRSSDEDDLQIKHASIKARADVIHVFRVGISKNEAFELGREITWTIEDCNGVELQAAHEVIQSLQNGEPVWHSCFCLEQPIAADRTPLRVRLITRHKGLMRKLKDKHGTEWMRAACHQDDEVEIQDYILALPETVKDQFMMVDLLDNIHRASEKPSQLEDMEKLWHNGRRMTVDEIQPYRKSHLNLSDYQFIGWRSKNVPPGAYTGALIERK